MELRVNVEGEAKLQTYLILKNKKNNKTRKYNKK